ncbi:MAG: leucine-rich repeat domain-containing protein [Deltaproteobacteria bacterium]|nr:leucine-rich repeat domain-containing protein [Deltaproteobacteria bacterium]
MHFDPCEAFGVIFGDPRLARCVREGGAAHPSQLRKLSCYQAGIRHLDGIEILSDLEELDLHFNEVQNGAPLAKLRKLKELHLGLNLCPDLRFLACMTALQSLTLFDNDIEDVTPLKNLRRMRILHIRINQIDDISPLASLTDLREISISSNYIDDIWPLAGCAKLEVLNMYKNDVTDLSVVRNMPSLKEAYIGDNPIRDLSPLFDHKDLIEIKFEGIPAPDAHKEHLLKVVAYNRYQKGLKPLNTLDPQKAAVRAASLVKPAPKKLR